MESILAQLGEAVEFGKVDKNSPYPPNLKGQDGADELAREALDTGIPPASILAVQYRAASVSEPRGDL